MAITASQVATTNTLEQFRSEFNNLRDDVSGLESGTISFSAITSTSIATSSITSDSIVFEGATDDAFETTLAVTDPTADRTITLPNETGTIHTSGGTTTHTAIVVADGATIGSASSTSAITVASTGIVTFVDDILIKDGGTIGVASANDAMTVSSAGIVTFKDDIIIKDGGTIGSSSDTDAISISSGGVVNISATTANTSASDGALTVAGGLGVAADVSIGDDLRLISDSAVLSFGADSDVTLTHAADTSLTLNVMMAATTFEPSGDTAAGDNAAIGYTSAEGLILTGQGSTNDVTIKNDADAIVMQIATGGTATEFIGNVTVGGDLDVTGSFDMSDANITNVGSIQLDSISGDGDTNTSITFSGSDVITIATGGTTAATFDANQILTLADDLRIKDGGTIGVASATTAITIASTGVVTFVDDIIIKDAGTIGSASDTDAISISSGGVVNISATTANTSASDGALTVAGGLGVAADASIGDDLRLISDAAVLSFGADSDVTLTHVADTGILLNSTMAIQFNDASQYINAPSATVLDINATDEIELNATLMDINGNVEISGTTAQVGVSTSTAKDIFNAGLSVKNGASGPGFIEFFEDSDHGTNKVIVQANSADQSYSGDVTLTLPNATDTIASSGEATALAIALG